MKVQLHCIARIHVVYLKEVDLLASLMVQSSSRRAPFLLGPQRQNKRTVFSVYLCILSPVPLLPRVLRNRSDHIDIPSTQHRSSKGSRRPTKARKPGSFRKWIPIRRVHNRMDKLTLTRQFGIQFGIFLG
ncbi:Ycf15, partial [Melia azedarach]